MHIKKWCDYDQALDGGKTGISYQELKNPDNLVWIDLKGWKNKNWLIKCASDIIKNIEKN